MDGPSDDPRPLKRVKIEGATNGVNTERDPSLTSIADDNMKEVEVGITAWVDESRPVLHGILKKRYTDFLVNEITSDGTVAHLRDLRGNFANEAPEKARATASRGRGEGEETNHDVPIEVNTVPQGSSASETEAGAGPAQPAPPQPQAEISRAPEPKIADEDRTKLVEYFSENTVQELTALYESVLRSPDKKSRDHPTVRTSFTSNRTLRSQIHQDIRRIFASKIESSTDKEGILVLTAAAVNIRGRGGAKFGAKTQPNKLGWHDRGGEYVHFNLYKENKDTMEVVSFLFRQLKMNSKSFQFAGTKDRRAVTVQRVSAYRVEPGRLAGVNKSLRYAAIGDYKYEKHGLELGELSGNEFVITLRDCRLGDTWGELGHEERITAAQRYLSESLTRLRDRGFLNFYGLQRFGSFSSRTDVIGLKILQGDFQAAVEDILQFSTVALEAARSGDTSTLVGQDDRARAEAINHWKTTGKTNEALDKLPRKFSAETALIRHLGRQRNDFLGALLNIQRNLRLMYVHAYQSLVFNLAVGERWKLFGERVVEGDLVLVHEHKDKDSHGQEVESGVDADGEVIIQPAGEDRAYDPDDRFERARALSAAEAEGGQYSIFDIVLPLPGFDVEYPANSLGGWYKTFMASERGGGLDPYNMRRKQKDFSLSGSYRKIFARIGETYSAETHAYDNDDKQFVKTDMDLIKERQHLNTGIETGGGAGSEKIEGGTGSVFKIAAVLKFQLGSSQYATMALRELSRGGIQAYKPEFMGGR